jgi:hypothetical protein
VVFELLYFGHKGAAYKVVLLAARGHCIAEVWQVSQQVPFGLHAGERRPPILPALCFYSRKVMAININAQAFAQVVFNCDFAPGGDGIKLHAEGGSSAIGFGAEQVRARLEVKVATSILHSQKGGCSCGAMAAKAYLGIGGKPSQVLITALDIGMYEGGGRLIQVLRDGRHLGFAQRFAELHHSRDIAKGLCARVGKYSDQLVGKRFHRPQVIKNACVGCALKSKNTDYHKK